MKMRAGDKIICECGQVAGGFRRDVEKAERITSEDIQMDMDTCRVENGAYQCLSCSKEMARIANRSWTVRTAKGWVT